MTSVRDHSVAAVNEALRINNVRTTSGIVQVTAIDKEWRDHGTYSSLRIKETMPQGEPADVTEEVAECRYLRPGTELNGDIFTNELQVHKSTGELTLRYKSGLIRISLAAPEDMVMCGARP
jgi:hypothetical protein